MAELELGNLYDINKKNMEQFKPYDAILLKKKCNEVTKEIIDDLSSQFWMLLCREKYDYTIFHLVSIFDNEEFTEALFDCLNNRGKVLDISRKEDRNYEIWIKRYKDEEIVVYYLFNYQYGVIEV
jgi:hypothetical protein